jgi:putative DNA primase/helicase
MTEEEGRTEAANALRLVARHGDVLRYAVEWKGWLAWDGQRWDRDTGGLIVQERAIEVAKDLWREIAKTTVKEGLLKQIVSFAMASNKEKAIKAAVTLARGKLAIQVGRLDQNPWLLNCQNGTLDLKTGKLRQPRQKDYITKLCPTPYDPAAKCPTWNQFLLQVFDGNLELIGYLQRLLGYGITGDVREQILPVFWGEGSNGKSTLVNAGMHVLGTDYGGSPPRELFSVSKTERHPTQLMTLHGKRLAAAQETDAGAKLNEALIKHLTGGDTVTARGMYENFTSFSPTHKLILSTNHKPQVLGTDHAVWRRLKLIEFKVRFEGNQVDKKLLDKLKAEAPGILAWMVRGCVEWQRSGLREPACVQIATRSYRVEQDVFGTFLQECCEFGDDYVVGATELYQAFQEWSPENGMTTTAFGLELGKRGFVKDHFTTGPHPGRRLWKGLRLSHEEKVGPRFAPATKPKTPLGKKLA